MSYSRKVILKTRPNNSANTPLPVLISLDTPFFYNPSAGNLLMDVRMNVGLGLGSSGDVTDMAASTSPFDQTSRVYEFDRNAISGMADTAGLLTGFKITPVPEPAPATLLIVGLAVASVFGLRKNNTKPRKE